MPTIDFITFCHPGDINRVYEGDWLERIIKSHNYEFSQCILVKQFCRGIPIHSLNVSMKIVESEDYYDYPVTHADKPSILGEFGLPEADSIADKMTHGPRS